jgi:glutathione synthase/RimK-type ligase-like ATP-grasp enzyme
MSSVVQNHSTEPKPSRKPIAIYYEHQQWFKPLFAELERRGAPVVHIDAAKHCFDPSNLNGEAGYSVLFNRTSPSAYNRGNAQTIFYTQSYLSHLEDKGKRVINGSKAQRYEISKALQLSLLTDLGIKYPKTRVINHPSQALVAAEGLRFPIVVKPNIGGSGAGVTKLDTPGQLQTAIDEGSLNLGIDDTALVQEFIPARGGYITRVELLGGKYLYAIRVFITGETFDLCPGDICKTTDGKELNDIRNACAVDAAKSGLRVEGYTPPPEVIEACEKIVQKSGIDVGGIEYIVDDRDGELLYYDVNALSNFVADAKNVIGFDPFVNLADYLEQEAR